MSHIRKKNKYGTQGGKRLERQTTLLHSTQAEQRATEGAAAVESANRAALKTEARASRSAAVKEWDQGNTNVLTMFVRRVRRKSRRMQRHLMKV